MLTVDKNVTTKQRGDTCWFSSLMECIGDERLIKPDGTPGEMVKHHAQVTCILVMPSLSKNDARDYSTKDTTLSVIEGLRRVRRFCNMDDHWSIHKDTKEDSYQEIPPKNLHFVYKDKLEFNTRRDIVMHVNTEIIENYKCNRLILGIVARSKKDNVFGTDIEGHYISAHVTDGDVRFNDTAQIEGVIVDGDLNWKRFKVEDVLLVCESNPQPRTDE